MDTCDYCGAPAGEPHNDLGVVIVGGERRSSVCPNDNDAPAPPPPELTEPEDDDEEE